MPNGTVATLPRIAIARPRPQRTAVTFVAELALVGALATAGIAVFVAALMVAVLAAPLVAAGLLWAMWRYDEGDASRQARRVRARLRRRARALGLTVLDPSPRETLRR